MMNASKVLKLSQASKPVQKVNKSGPVAAKEECGSKRSKVACESFDDCKWIMVKKQHNSDAKIGRCITKTNANGTNKNNVPKNAEHTSVDEIIDSIVLNVIRKSCASKSKKKECEASAPDCTWVAGKKGDPDAKGYCKAKEPAAPKAKQPTEKKLQVTKMKKVRKALMNQK